MPVQGNYQGQNVPWMRNSAEERGQAIDFIPVDMTTTRVAGDVAVVAITAQAVSDLATPVGWVKEYGPAEIAATNKYGYVFSRQMDGTEDQIVQFPHVNGNREYGCATQVIAGSLGNIDIASISVINSSTANPPNNSFPDGRVRHGVAIGLVNVNYDVSSYPNDLPDGRRSPGWGGNYSYCASTQFRGSSYNPGAFQTQNNASDPISHTVLVW